jgi:hypothetical protein
MPQKGSFLRYLSSSLYWLKELALNASTLENHLRHPHREDPLWLTPMFSGIKLSMPLDNFWQVSIELSLVQHQVAT